jgi:HAD superfamily hydrolase (TIGR01509 family)
MPAGRGPGDMDAVCFDMDGVLVNSEDFWVEREEGELFPRLAPDDEIDIEEITGMNYREIYDYLAGEYDLAMDKAETVAWYDDAAADIYGEQVTLLPGTHDLFSALRDRGVAVGLVSSSPHDWITVVRERFDLDPDAVVSSEDVDGPGKPEATVYERAADELGVEPSRAVAIEDSQNGITAARRAGLHVVGFKYGDTDDTDRSDADAVADDPDALRKHVRSLVAE